MIDFDTRLFYYVDCENFSETYLYCWSASLYFIYFFLSWSMKNVHFSPFCCVNCFVPSICVPIQNKPLWKKRWASSPFAVCIHTWCLCAQQRQPNIILAILTKEKRKKINSDQPKQKLGIYVIVYFDKFVFLFQFRFVSYRFGSDSCWILRDISLVISWRTHSHYTCLSEVFNWDFNTQIRNRFQFTYRVRSRHRIQRNKMRIYI